MLREEREKKSNLVDRLFPTALKDSAQSEMRAVPNAHSTNREIFVTALFALSAPCNA